MYKKHWNENGKNYRLEIKEQRVNTQRISGVSYYKTVYKLKIFEKYKWFIGWRNIYQNQWEDNDLDIETRINKCLRDCFVRNRHDKV